ncbi:Ankyrin-3 [Trichoplax sp. H2]|nr:Ankyrin-3 [Trichoplax sp. H2]|eukprot:RDD42485.1 Ankyrin-3 [Trichoplax sp. H2]
MGAKKENSTALHIAAWKGEGDALTLLLKNGADPNIANKLEERPIHYAAVEGNLYCVKKLREFGASVSPENMQGQTPLHEAVRFGHDNIALWLLRQGAAVNHQDNYGDTPLHVATQHNCHESILILLENGADSSILNQQKKGKIEKLLNILVVNRRENVQLFDRKWDICGNGMKNYYLNKIRVALICCKLAA